MFTSVLIANRGEIACRIMRTAKRMGIRTIAVYSDADADAQHVALADEAVHIGGSPAAHSYLCIDKIIAACKATGAQAVHPGYGFLSERVEFVEALTAAGIIFVGPNALAVRAMGDKIESKRMAKQAGVSVVPGGQTAIVDVQQAEAESIAAGFPVLLKASAGGGGRGMRVVERVEDLAAAFDATRAEALGAFGDDRVFVEKYIVQPRHIEIQVLGDKHGNVVHLGERECSIQRRHQKLIEEAPSPFISDATRQKMGAQAVQLAKAVGYDSAGTVEFIVDAHQNFYFLEMNTRLQVEHPVTEFITGLDLVELMFRSAAGEHLAMTQNDVKLNGHAIETRLCAEDPSRNFLPSTGRIHTLEFPTGNVRVDTGVTAGSEVSVFYDSLIAKIITYAPTRAHAIALQAQALNATVLEGVSHSGAFLNHVMHHPRFMKGDFSTAFMAEEFPKGYTPQAPHGVDATEFAVVAACIDRLSNWRRQHISGQLREEPYTFPAVRVVYIGTQQVKLRASGSRDAGYLIEVLNKKDEATHSYEVDSEWKFGQHLWHGQLNGAPICVQVKPVMNGVHLAANGMAADVHVFTPVESAAMALMPEPKLRQDIGRVCSPMPGLVKHIAVEVGQAVVAGELLCIIEAMKMENQLRAEMDGIVKSIAVPAGSTVMVDAELMMIG